jgi:hypothetical protein
MWQIPPWAVYRIVPNRACHRSTVKKSEVFKIPIDFIKFCNNLATASLKHLKLYLLPYLIIFFDIF